MASYYKQGSCNVSNNSSELLKLVRSEYFMTKILPSFSFTLLIDKLSNKFTFLDDQPGVLRLNLGKSLLMLLQCTQKVMVSVQQHIGLLANNNTVHVDILLLHFKWFGLIYRSG